MLATPVGFMLAFVPVAAHPLPLAYLSNLNPQGFAQHCGLCNKARTLTVGAHSSIFVTSTSDPGEIGKLADMLVVLHFFEGVQVGSCDLHPTRSWLASCVPLNKACFNIPACGGLVLLCLRSAMQILALSTVPQLMEGSVLQVAEGGVLVVHSTIPRGVRLHGPWGVQISQPLEAFTPSD